MLGFKAPDFMTIWKRLAAEQAELDVPLRTEAVAIDSTGLSTTEPSKWLRDKWSKHRGFVKAHVAADVANLDIFGIVVTDDKAHDAEAFFPLVQQVLDRGIVIKRVLADC